MMGNLLPRWIHKMTLASEAAADPASLRIGVPDGCDLLVIDHYGLDRAYEQALRGWANRTVALNDLPDRPHDVDVLLDQTPGRSSEHYAALVPPACRLLLGGDYALLREQFSAARLSGARDERLPIPPYRLLVSAGLGDSEGLALRILDGIQMTGLECEVVVLAGSSTPVLPELQFRSRNASRLSIEVDSEDVARHLRWADLAVGTAGTSSWERCSLGVPSVLLISAANQEGVADALERAGAARVLRGGMLSASAIGAALRDSLRDSSVLARMSAGATRICDGLGAMRAALHLDPEFADDGQVVSVRRFGPDDEELLFRWQTSAGVRRYSRNPNPPSRAEHAQWTADRLTRTRAITETVIHGDAPAGIVRLDPHDNNNMWEVSILIDPARHSRGVGSSALRCLRRLVPDVTICAAVDPRNLASLGLFRKLGYLARGEWLVSDPAVMARSVA
jgi:UDP-2,4-diacetamido-2,4,6-trideoxy-beta-L-altropyranose hydrolase